ncbi:uncharacterized protein LOC143287219 [Babylonia areolata]|uniref:uncharacterized protein LOC143287219 n=1 Tax=Babylonia areolata TaxID=304850 RepID=UPI003FD606DD
MAFNPGSDLDALIHSLEYENQQHVKMIEKENQRNAYLESQEEEKQRVIADLQSQITTLEADTKNNHKQLVHNKNTLESLKKSKCVLQAHRDALSKHLDALQFENNKQRRELEDTVQMYEKTWSDYEAQYKALALYQKMLEEEDRLAQSQAEQDKWQQRKNQLQGKIRRAQDELDFRDWYRFCIKIAEKWVSIGRKEEELLAAVREKENLQAKLKEIREKNISVSVTPNESAQDMDTESSHLSLTEPSEKEETEDSVAEEDLTLVSGDGGDTGGVEREKENVGTDQEAIDGRETVPHLSSSGQNFTIQEASDTRLPALVNLSTISPVQFEESMEEDGGRPADDIERFEPVDISTPVVTGPRSSGRKPLQPLQLTPTPRVCYQPPILTVPKIRMGMQQRPNPSPQVSAPKILDVPKKAVAAPITTMQPVLSTAPPHSRPRPPRLPVPQLSIPRPSPHPSPLSQVPTVRSAVSSILTGARPVVGVVEKLVKPVAVPTMPRVPLPRTPLLAPPPSPVLSPFPRPSTDKGGGGGGGGGGQVLQSEWSKAVCSSSGGGEGGTAVAGGSGEVCGEGSDLLDPARSIPADLAAESHAPGPLKPNDKQGARPISDANAVLSRPAATPELPTPGAGDAPPVQHPGKTDHPSTKHEGTQKESASAIYQDEEMDFDSESRGSSQPFGTPHMSEGTESQLQSNAFSPFNLDKHKQKLLELNEDSGDSFNFEQRHLFLGGDKMVDHPPDSTTSASSIFNMAFVSSPSVPKEPSGVPLFKDVTSPIACPPPGTAAPMPPRSREEERGGSFFSFEAMDTGESGGGLSLLSMFGGGSSNKEPEPAFSFNFGASSADSGNGSAFSFSFGGVESEYDHKYITCMNVKI